MKKIALVGAGFAGLSTAIALKEKMPFLKVHLFDPTPVDQRASARAFLLHPFIHPKAKLNENGFEAFEASYRRIKKAEERRLQSFSIERPFLKLINHEKHLKDFKASCESFSGLTFGPMTLWGHPGVWVEKSVQVEAYSYLKALEKWALDLGIIFYSKFFSPKNKEDYDFIFYCMGDQLKNYFPKLFEEFTCIKGQVLYLKKPKDFHLEHAISAHKCHLIPLSDQKTLLLASTYERSYESSLPDVKITSDTLLPKLNFLNTKLSEKDILECKSGVRFYAPDKRAKIAFISDKEWALCALGSKGLLYHAKLSELLIDAFTEKVLKGSKEYLAPSRWEDFFLEKRHSHSIAPAHTH